MADNHLGYRQYGLYQREIDYYDTFKTAIKKILELRPDFVIHSGDLFEFFRSPPKALFEVQKGLKKLQEKNIPVYAIPGNHDSDHSETYAHFVEMLRNYIYYQNKKNPIVLIIDDAQYLMDKQLCIALQTDPRNLINSISQLRYSTKNVIFIFSELAEVGIFQSCKYLYLNKI